MKPILFLLLLLAGGKTFCQQSSQTLSVEKIMRDPKWIGTSPSAMFWSFDSRSLYFNWNPDHAISDSFYVFEMGGKGPQKSSYRKAVISKAISEGHYNQSRTKITYTYKGDVYLLDIDKNQTTRITQTASEENALGFCNSDSWVVFQSGSNLFSWDIQSGVLRQLTDFLEADAPSEKKIGAAEQWLKDEQKSTSAIVKQRADKKAMQKNYLQEVKETDTLVPIHLGSATIDRLSISPDARFIAYVTFEKPKTERNTVVPNYVTETGFTTDIPGRSKVGAAQGSYNLFVFDRSSGKVHKAETSSLPGIGERPKYFKEYPSHATDTSAYKRELRYENILWNQDGSVCIVDVRSEDNKDRWLAQMETSSAHLISADHQHDDAWIGGPGIGWLGGATLGWINNQEFFFQSEETGYSHLYTYNFGSHTRKALTKGNYELVDVTLSPDRKWFYYLSNEDHPGKSNLYRMDIDGSTVQKLTQDIGGYQGIVSPDGKSIAYRYSYQNKPWELFVRQSAPGGKPRQVTDQAMSEEFKGYPWRDTRIFSFPARDGMPVFARMYEPTKGKKNNAAVIFVHGAGYLQNVAYAWSGYFREYMFNNLLADKGYTVIDIDYRASAGYGRDWRTGIYRHMGGKDLDDEIDAARMLVRDYQIDSARIGIYGGSYGGFMTLMALFTEPGVFKAGAALRPVTDWAHYNHGYTSAILNDPVTDSLAYVRSSPIGFAAGLKNHLLICHGMVDQNVHFQDAVRLSQRLIELGKSNWELAVYPVEDHGFVESSSWTDEYKRILQLFETYLN